MLQETTTFIRTITDVKPKIGLVLGSGLGSFVKEIQVTHKISYSEIPNFLPTSVEGHNGVLIFGNVGDVPIAVLQGRVHYYEGHSMAQVVFPVRVLSMLGIETVILTNAAGGLKSRMARGDFMVISDHINLMGSNPLMGPNIKNLGPRFPDMTEAYDANLVEQMRLAMKKNKVRHHIGVYCGVSGPTYETPSEVKYLQQLGGSAVGMSTVPESIAANHLGLRVAAISCITNLAAGLGKGKLSHEEVTETAKMVEQKFNLFMKDFITNLK